jgi:hypothetical protein
MIDMLPYIWFLSVLFVIHYMADFFVQVYTWKKSAQWIRNLIVHTVTYVFVVTFGIIILGTIFPELNLQNGDILGFVMVNGAAHFITDLGTKKLSKTLRDHNEITGFVNVVALDQCVHYITLLITFGLFFLMKI